VLAALTLIDDGGMSVQPVIGCTNEGNRDDMMDFVLNMPKWRNVIMQNNERNFR
jgi:hypothetical protein